MNATSHGFPTTRRYARTACGAGGAFPHSADYAAAIERPARPVPAMRSLAVLTAVCGVVGFVAQVLL